MNDVRYSELKFLQMLASGSRESRQFFDINGERSKFVGLSGDIYVDMACTLAEDLYVRIENQHIQLLVARLRGETAQDYPRPRQFQEHEWQNPRETLHSALAGQRGGVQTLVLTYRGMRRIEELRELLRRDRILEPFGVLLDLRYAHPDLEDALRRAADIPVSVLYADMDHFKPVNDQFGHEAGDVVMKAYLEAVHTSIASFGQAYRGRGDEVVGIITGQGHQRAMEIAEDIRTKVATMDCEFKGTRLPKVTTSIGVATTPPETRGIDIEAIAEGRNQQAKKAGRNRVVGTVHNGNQNA